MYTTNNKYNVIKKILLILLILFLIIGGVLSYLLFQSNKTKESIFKESLPLVIEGSKMTSVKEKYSYIDKQSYHIFIGEDDDGNELLSSIKLNKDKNKKKMKNSIETFKMNQFISSEKMTDIWEETCDSCQLISVKPAIIKDNNLWEIIYTDKSNRYIFDYRFMTDGTEYEVLKLKQNYN